MGLTAGAMFVLQFPHQLLRLVVSRTTWMSVSAVGTTQTGLSRTTSTATLTVTVKCEKHIVTFDAFLLYTTCYHVGGVASVTEVFTEENN